VRHGIAIRVSVEPYFTRPINATEPQRSVTAERVRVGSQPDTNSALCRGQVGWSGEFGPEVIADNGSNGATPGSPEVCVVGEIPCDRGERNTIGVCGESLRGLHPGEFLAIGRFHNNSVADNKHGVDNGQDGHDSIARCVHKFSDSTKHIGGHPRASDVVDEDDINVGKRGESGANTRGSGVTAHNDSRISLRGGHNGVNLFYPIRWRGDNDSRWLELCHDPE
jgi:hypothetical protein